VSFSIEYPHGTSGVGPAPEAGAPGSPLQVLAPRAARPVAVGFPLRSLARVFPSAMLTGELSNVLTMIYSVVGRVLSSSEKAKSPEAGDFALTDGCLHPVKTKFVCCE